jgi:hypothetical protein
METNMTNFDFFNDAPFAGVKWGTLVVDHRATHEDDLSVPGPQVELRINGSTVYDVPGDYSDLPLAGKRLQFEYPVEAINVLDAFHSQEDTQKKREALHTFLWYLCARDDSDEIHEIILGAADSLRERQGESGGPAPSVEPPASEFPPEVNEAEDLGALVDALFDSEEGWGRIVLRLLTDGYSIHKANRD